MDFKSIRKEINNKNISVKELINEFLLKIDTSDNKINSYICTTKDNAISQAESIDKLIQNGDKLPPLAGIPLAIKDIASKILVLPVPFWPKKIFNFSSKKRSKFLKFLKLIKFMLFNIAKF